jgi:hypothetical protein
MITDYRSSNILPFDYVYVTPSIVGNGSHTGSLTLANDSEFEFHAFFATSTQDADTDIMPNNFSIMMTDASTGRQLSSARVPQRCWSGPANGGFYRLLRPILFMPGGTVTFDILDLSGSTSVITVVLRGFKIFRNQ